MNALVRDIARRLKEGEGVVTIAQQPLPGMTREQTRAFVGRIADEVFNLGVDYHDAPPPQSFPTLSPEKDQARRAAYTAGLSDAESGALCGIKASAYREWRSRVGLPANINRGSQKRRPA
jgi:hypothetical protein